MSTENEPCAHIHDYDLDTNRCRWCGNAKLLEGRWPTSTWLQIRLRQLRMAELEREESKRVHHDVLVG